MLEEYIVLLNDHGESIGSAPKLESHHKNTPLHLAFSIYIFNREGKILVTQRAHHKKVWPGVWTNSCCGHPLPGEKMITAIDRKVEFELGMTVTNVRPVLPRYRYKTPPFNGIIENEICPVFFGITDDTPNPNPDEVADFKWLDWNVFQKYASKDSHDKWSWWCKDQLAQLQTLGNAYLQ